MAFKKRKLDPATQAKLRADAALRKQKKKEYKEHRKRMWESRAGLDQPTNKEIYARMTEADKEYMRRLGGNPEDLLKEEESLEDKYLRKHGIDPGASAQS